MSQKDTGFDAFFKAVTRSPEFKAVATKDWKGDFSASIKDMEKNIAKAGEISRAFNATFATQEAIATGDSLHTNTQNKSQSEQKQTQTNDKKDTSEYPLDIEYFTKTNPDTWGFAGVAGMEKLKREVEDGFIRPLQFFFLVKDLKKRYEKMPLKEIDTDTEKKEKMLVDLYESYEAFQVGIPTGMLLYGPPGTGKTFFTKKLAQELGAGLIKKSVGELGSSYLHETSKNIKAFFDAARKVSEAGPTILFLDEIDSLVSKRDDKVDANKAEEVSQFLQEFNKLSQAPNLIVIAATNRPDHLDSALLRSGRLDKKYYIGAPDFTARKELFEIFLKKAKRPHSDDINFEHLAELTLDYVAADIEAIVEEAARDASGNILKLAKKIQEHDGDIRDLTEVMQNHEITQELLEIAISETRPSINMVDMSVFENWEKTLT